MQDHNIEGFKQLSILLMRLSFGLMFFYAGFSKVIDPSWTSFGYLQNAKTFSSFYDWLAGPGILPFVDLINQWGLLIIGVCLILGLFTRWVAFWGAIMMLLYYFPILNFPYAGANSFLIDQHIIYILTLIFLGFTSAGRIFGIDELLFKLHDR